MSNINLSSEDGHNIKDALEYLLDTVEEDPDEFQEGAAESLKQTLRIFRLLPDKPTNIYLD